MNDSSLQIAPDEAARRGALLTKLLGVAIFGIAAATVASFGIGGILASQQVTALGAMLSLAGCVWLVRAGRLDAAARIFVTVGGLMALSSLVFDPTSNIYTGTYCAVLVIAGLVANSRTVLTFGASAVLAVLAVHALQHAEVITLRRPLDPPGIPVMQAIIIGLLTVLMYWDNAGRVASEEVRRRLHDQLVQAQKMEALGRLAGGISHDFNNLLMVVLSRVELLLEDEQDETVRRSLLAVHEAAERGADLTRRLSAFGRKGRAGERLYLDDVVLDFEQILRRMVPEGVVLTFDLDAREPMRGDPSQLQQVLANLAVNAAQAMDGRGTLCIRTRLMSDEVWLRVIDSGPGIDAPAIDRVFDPFFTTKPVGKGTGLGLSVVHGIVAQSGGSVDIERTGPDGTVVRAVFPTVSGNVSWSARPAPVRTSASLSGLTVLLVDDDPAVVASTSAVLAGAGAAVVVANDPRTARSVVAERCDIGLVLSDVRMPEINGPELIAMMREDGYDGPVVYVSGFSEGGGLPVPPDAVLLRKPIAPAALTAALRDALDA